MLRYWKRILYGNSQNGLDWEEFQLKILHCNIYQPLSSHCDVLILIKLAKLSIECIKIINL